MTCPILLLVYGHHQAPLSMGFSRQEYWSGLPCPLPGDLSNPRIEPTSPESPAFGRQILYHWATGEPLGRSYIYPVSTSICIHIDWSMSISIHIYTHTYIYRLFYFKDWLMWAQMVMNLPAMPETQVQSLGQENPLEKAMTTHSCILAWRILWTEKPGGLQSMGSQRVIHDWVTKTFTFSLSCDF